MKLWRAGPVAVAALLTHEAAAAPKPHTRAAPRIVKWEWPKFRPAEYLATAGMFAGAFGLRFGAKSNAEPNWVHGMLLDGALYRSAYPKTASSRTAWNVAGDVPFASSFVWATADPILAGLRHGWEIGSQMFLLNLEGYATYSVILWSSQYLLRRRRPADSACDGQSGPASSDRCDDPMSVRAFIGGHTGLVTTTASLTCLHHSYMPLFGGGIRDVFPCAFWIAGAALTFTSRTVTGSHYLSDNLFGLGVGAFSGWVVPWALHYVHGPRPWPLRARTRTIRQAWLAPAELGAGTTLHLAGGW